MDPFGTGGESLEIRATHFGNHWFSGKKRKGELRTGERSDDCACESYWKNRCEVLACVCVCVRERERERIQKTPIYLSVSVNMSVMEMT